MTSPGLLLTVMIQVGAPQSRVRDWKKPGPQPVGRGIRRFRVRRPTEEDCMGVIQVDTNRQSWVYIDDKWHDCMFVNGRYLFTDITESEFETDLEFELWPQLKVKYWTWDQLRAKLMGKLINISVAFWIILSVVFLSPYGQEIERMLTTTIERFK